MSSLNTTTRRRLQKLPQIPSVWEGDRRPLTIDDADLDEPQGECIIWVDGSEGVVRGMEVISADIGPEAVVRTLLRAMEHPQSPAKPARPLKIIVRDRELQFFLRGVLQELGINIDYVPSLPLIDDLFQSFQEAAKTKPPKLPAQYAKLLTAQTAKIWQLSPWDLLADHQILSISINHGDIGSLYVSVMGMMGTEYGLVLYRSLDSLKRFRAAVLAEESLSDMEAAFLGQDCLFVTFHHEGDNEYDEDIDIGLLPASLIGANFGNVHPLEGMRPFLYDEEALAVYIALVALHNFVKENHRKLAKSPTTLPKLTKSFTIDLPYDIANTITVEVSTLPDLSQELWEMAEFFADDDDDDFDFDDDDDDFNLRDDLVPDNSFLSLGMITWDKLEILKKQAEIISSGEIKPQGEGLPMIMIQTTRPKAKTMIETIKNAEGLKAIGFTIGENEFLEIEYDLGILQTENGEFFLFGEFNNDDPTHLKARENWDERTKNSDGYCGLLIAKGVTGASRGNPDLKDMVALFIARSVSNEELGIGTLSLMPNF